MEQKEEACRRILGESMELLDRNFKKWI